MAVVYFKEVASDDGSVDREGVREYTRKFIARTNSRLDRARTILIYPECPKPYMPHPEDPGAFAVQIRPSRRSSFVWDVTASYTSDFSEDEKEPNPLQRPIRFSWDSVEVTRPVLFDRNGRPLLNKAGDPFDPPIEEEEARWVITVERNYPAVPRYLLSYPNSVNDATVRIQGIAFPKGTLRLKGLKIPDVQVENDVAFYPVSYQLHHREEGWARRVLNTGYQELVTTQSINSETGKLEEKTRKKRILVAGEPPAQPVFLDENGRRPRHTEPGPLFGDVKEQLAPEDIVVLSFDLVKELPFGKLLT